METTEKWSKKDGYNTKYYTKNGSSWAIRHANLKSYKL